MQVDRTTHGLWTRASQNAEGFHQRGIGCSSRHEWMDMALLSGWSLEEKNFYAADWGTITNN